MSELLWKSDEQSKTDTIRDFLEWLENSKYSYIYDDGLGYELPDGSGICISSIDYILSEWNKSKN